MEPATAKSRVRSLDVLRGLVMVIMALDHLRDYLYRVDIHRANDFTMNPTNLKTTYPMLFFTRWITHFCAPVFVFLAGVSVYLMCQRRSRASVSGFLIRRGLWLIFVELVIITFGWTFNPFFNLFILQVIWAIGISMILLGGVVRLPYRVVLITGVVLVAAHNLLDQPALARLLKGHVLADLAYYSDFTIYRLWGRHFFLIVYSFLPWTGIMFLGYGFGKLYENGVTEKQRRAQLLRWGWGLILVFVLLRLINHYGDPEPWSVQPRGTVYTILSFLNVTKYPPSLLYTCMTLGPAMLFLALVERVQNRFTGIMNIYGRVPMFYYIIHIYLIHVIGIIVFFAQGFGAKDIVSPNVPFLFKPNGIGFGLLNIYLLWMVVVLVMYPLCRRYNRYKSSHRSWWLSYL